MLKHNQDNGKETSNCALQNVSKITICEEEFRTIPVLKPLNSVSSGSIREIPDLLHYFMGFFGILQTSRDSKQKIKLIVLISLAFLILADQFRTSLQIILRDSSLIEINLAYTVCLFLPIPSWFELRFKRTHLMKAIQELENISSNTHKSKINYLVIILCSMPFIYSISTIIVSKSNHYLLIISFEFEPKNQWLQNLVLFLRCFFYFLYYPILSDFIALLYCTLCLRCCNAIEQLTLDVIQCAPENFGTSTQIKILTQRDKFDNILSGIQNSFSCSSFFIILANILSCGSILGSLLKGRLDEIQSSTLISWTFYTTNSFGSLTAILWIAGGVPLALDRLKKEYFKKAHQKMLIAPIPEEPKLEKWLFDSPDFILTGCNIFSYRRNSLLAVIGTVLTYTFLVINK
ncbi:uncharacterized protein TNCT_129211 [Trichonephila clavata]|uniref:Uncharacterized protein n=1 Tax=Trichonephila clavata TaxID=2740835 RepID=A0A8X6LSD3_TRICU|nr:uncharacterized protein TNCT_129211 [Trichonephila clavata]